MYDDLIKTLRATTPSDSGYAESANLAADAIERLLGPAQAPVPAAWLYEMAFYIKPSDPEPFKKWKWVATIEPPPTIPKDGVRNVHPLYTSVPSTERCDEIQPHTYSPDYQAMGDCRVCGHGPDATAHRSGPSTDQREGGK
jgi:hypothetical protein